MNDVETNKPPPVIYLSPTEMTGDWPAEVEKKLLDRGLDPEAAARLAGVAEAEMRRLAAKAEAGGRPSVWRRFLRFLGLAS